MNPTLKRLMLESPRCGIVRRGLVGWYRFDEGAGQVLHDYSQLGNNGTLGSTPGPDTNDPTWTGQGLYFTTDDYVNLNKGRLGGTGLFAGPGEQFTLILVATNDGTSQTIIARCVNNTTEQKTFQIYASGSTTFYYVLRGTMTARSGMWDAVQPHAFMVRWDGQRADCCRDNFSNRSVLGVGTAAEEVSQNIFLGARSGGTASFLTGNEYYCLIYDRALSDAEYSQTYKAIKAELAGRGVVLP